MQLASALQTSVKFDLHAARVVILLLALTSLLLPAASETLRQASDAPLNSLVHSSKEAGSDAVAAGAEGPPTANSSQHPVACNRPEPSPETKVRGSDDAAPLVCHTSELLHAFVPPAADSCPAEGIVDKSAHDATVCKVQADTNETVTPQRLVPIDEANTPSQPHPSDPSPSEEEWHNFALSKDGAKIVASNKESKKASAILDTDSDTFMKNECKADKWFIIELSQVAKVAAFQLSQYELYSSRVKHFEVRGRQTHPRAQGGDYVKTFNTTGWPLLGKYIAAKMKGSQTFTVAEPVWLKYLQFHLISHHGNEPICALNDVLIFGKSAAEDLEDQLSDEALLTADDNPQQPDTALDPSAATDRPHAAVDVNKLDKSAAGGPQPDSSSGHAVKHSAAAVEANAGEMTNKSNMSDVLLPGKAASDASRQQSATEHASGGHQPGVAVHADKQDPALSNQKVDSMTQHATAPHTGDTDAEPTVKGSHATPESNTDSKADPSAEELLLLHNSASSSKARHGGSIYDMLVQEIKSLKLQQKQAPRQLAELQRNLSMFMEKTAAELSALDQAVKGLQSDLDSLQRVKVNPEESNTAVARFSDVEVDLHSVLVQLESMQKVLHQVNHRSTDIGLLAIIGWLGVLVMTAPALGRLTWILWLPILVIGAIGVVWVLPVGLRILPITSM